MPRVAGIVFAFSGIVRLLSFFQAGCPPGIQRSVTAFQNVCIVIHFIPPICFSCSYFTICTACVLPFPRITCFLYKAAPKPYFIQGRHLCFRRFCHFLPVKIVYSCQLQIFHLPNLFFILSSYTVSVFLVWVFSVFPLFFFSKKFLFQIKILHIPFFLFFYYTKISCCRSNL